MLSERSSGLLGDLRALAVVLRVLRVKALPELHVVQMAATAYSLSPAPRSFYLRASLTGRNPVRRTPHRSGGGGRSSGPCPAASLPTAPATPACGQWRTGR